MTWTKLGDEFPDECERVQLSDAAFRLHVEGLAWSNRLGLDGRIPKKHLRRFAFTEYPEVALAELYDAGFWADDTDVMVIRHHIGEQIEPVIVEARKDNERNRKQKQRYTAALVGMGVDVPKQAKGELTADYVKALRLLLNQHKSRDMSRDKSADNPRDPGRVGSGLELQKQQLREEQPDAQLRAVR